MNYARLRQLIDAEPANAARTDVEVMDWANAETEAVDSETLSPSDVFAAILENRAEWAAMQADDRELVRDILVVHTDGIPTEAGSPARSVLQALLGNATKAALGAKIGKTVSPAEKAGLPRVRLGDVETARAL